VKRLWDDDELTAEWTLEPSDQSLLANKTGATRLRFAALLTFFRHEGRFPASKHEVPAAVVAHLARQVGVLRPNQSVQNHAARPRTKPLPNMRSRDATRSGGATTLFLIVVASTWAPTMPEISCMSSLCLRPIWTDA
jgi:hypothetical protein